MSHRHQCSSQSPQSPSQSPQSHPLFKLISIDKIFTVNGSSLINIVVIITLIVVIIIIIIIIIGMNIIILYMCRILILSIRNCNL